jgi:arginine decarboxylase
MQGWTIRDSLELYSVPAWGRGFFSISQKGTVEVLPSGPGGPAVDLLELVGDLGRRGLRTPLLIRFSDILASRVKGIAKVFDTTIAEYEYRGRFRGVYPIKVNQQRHVVE